jgi:hypothetical protein
MAKVLTRASFVDVRVSEACSIHSEPQLNCVGPPKVFRSNFHLVPWKFGIQTRAFCVVCCVRIIRGTLERSPTQVAKIVLPSKGKIRPLLTRTAAMQEWLASLAGDPPPSATRRDPYLYAPVRTGERDSAAAAAAAGSDLPVVGRGADGGAGGEDDEAPAGVSHPLLLRSSSSSAAAVADGATTARGFSARARQLLSHLSLAEISGTRSTQRCTSDARLLVP